MEINNQGRVGESESECECGARSSRAVWRNDEAKVVEAESREENRVVSVGV